MSLGKGFVTSFSRKQMISTQSRGMMTCWEACGINILRGTRVYTGGTHFKLAQQQCSLPRNELKCIKLPQHNAHEDLVLFIKDKVDSGEVQMQVQYCLTNEMWAGVFMKPLKGEKLKKYVHTS